MKSIILAVVVVMMMCVAEQSVGQTAAGTAQNGILVKAQDEIEAVQAALGRFIDLLNQSLSGEEADTDGNEEALFGGWLTKRHQLVGEGGPTNREKLRLLFSRKGSLPVNVLRPTEGAMPIGVPKQALGSYVAILPLRNSGFRFGVLFFEIEALDQAGDGQFDVAFLPGMIFVGEPKNDG